MAISQGDACLAAVDAQSVCSFMALGYWLLSEACCLAHSIHRLGVNESASGEVGRPPHAGVVDLKMDPNTSWRKGPRRVGETAFHVVDTPFLQGRVYDVIVSPRWVPFVCARVLRVVCI